MDTPWIAQLNVDWSALTHFAEFVGVVAFVALTFAVLGFLLLRMREGSFREVIKSWRAESELSAKNRENDAKERALQWQVTQDLATALKGISEKYDERLVAIEKLIEQNRLDEIEFRKTTIKALETMTGQVNIVKAEIVSDMSQRIESSERTTGEAIVGVNTTINAADANQTKRLEMAVDDLKGQIKANGDATRAQTAAFREEIKAQITELRDQVVAQSDELKHIADAQTADADEKRRAIADVSATMERLASKMTEMAEGLVPHVDALPSSPQPDPLTQPQKHATGNLPALPADSPDKTKPEEPKP